MTKKIALLVAAILWCCRAPSAFAEDAGGQFYRGKTITIVVGTTAGGPYDAYAQLLGQFLTKHIPGRPTIIVTNMPGASGATAAGYVARVAAKDGTFINATNASEPLLPILQDTRGLKFDSSRVNYLGSVASADWLCIVRSDAPATTFEEMLKTPVIIGGTVSTVAASLPTVLNNVVGTKFKMVLGYPGANEIMMAIDKNEIQGRCGVGWSSLKSGHEDLIESGKIKIVVQVSDKGLPKLNQQGVPLIGSYLKNDRQRKILEIFNSQATFAYPYFVAPEVPPDRLQILRRAFMDALHDPDLLAAAAKMNFDIEPASGEQIHGLLKKIYASPPDLIQGVREALVLKK